MPIAVNRYKSFFRTGSFSNKSMDNGTQVGHIIWAKVKNVYTEIIFKCEYSGLFNAIHTNPSVNCCSPKTKGIPANISWDGDSDFFNVISPTVAKVIPAVKLAVAEKHIRAKIIYCHF